MDYLTEPEYAQQQATGATETETAKQPARGTPEAARTVARTLGWDKLGVTLERVEVDGYEADSLVSMHLNNGRCISATVAQMYNRTRFPATVGAALQYGCPILKQNELVTLVGHILGLATVTEMFSSIDEARSWGIAYLGVAERVAYDDRDNASAEQRYKVLAAQRDAGKLARDTNDNPPSTVLQRTTDGALLVVRSWFHQEVREHLSGDRGLSVQRIGSLMRQVGWRRPAARHWKIAAREPGTRKHASLDVYLVSHDWESEVLDDAG